MKALKLLQSVSMIVFLLVIGFLLITSIFPNFWFNVFSERLDSWVAAGGPVANVQSDVVSVCGRLVVTQGGFFALPLFETISRNDFNFRVDACTKLTVNRVYPQPEFANPQIVKIICQGSDQFFKRLCARTGLPTESGLTGVEPHPLVATSPKGTVLWLLGWAYDYVSWFVWLIMAIGLASLCFATLWMLGNFLRKYVAARLRRSYW